MEIKRILAGGLAALMAGTTLAFGAFAVTTLDDFVTPPTDSTLSSPVIVVGDMSAGALSTAAIAQAKAEDTIAAADIAAAMMGYATTTGTCAATGEGMAVSSGADISTANTKLYLGDGLNTAKSTLTKSDLPTILASGTVTVSGTAYTYDQYINLESKAITFGKSSQTIEPQLYIDMGANAQTPAYNATVVFNKPLNISDASNVQGKTLDIFGGSYLIATGSGATTAGYDPLILYDAGLTQTLTQDVPVTVNIDDTDYTIEATYVGSTTAVIKVNEESTDPLAAAGSDVRGGLNVYVKSILYKGVQGQTDKVIVSLGSGKLTLGTGNKAKFGQSAETSVDKTLVTMTGDGNGLSKMMVSVGAQKSSEDYVLIDEQYTDPVFKGFKLGLGGITPALDSSARSTITIEPSGSLGIQLSMTDYRGEDVAIIIAYDNDSSSSSITPVLTDATGYEYHVLEGELVQEDEYVILAQGDFSHLFQVTDINNLGESTAAVTLKDMFSEDVISVSMTSPGYRNATFYVDGQAYYVNITEAEDLSFTWGTTAGVNDTGNQTTIFPYLRGQNGELVAIVGNTTFLTLANATYYDVPGGNGDTGRSSMYIRDDGLGYTSVSAGSENSVTAGQLTWYIMDQAPTGASPANQTIYNVSGVSLYDDYPAIIVLEEKGRDMASALKRDAIIAKTKTDGQTSPKLSISTSAGDVTMTASTKSTGNNSIADTYEYHELDRYGTYVKYDTYTQGKVEIFYPDTQGVMTAAFGIDPTFSTSAAAAGSTYEAAVPITNAVAKFASEIAATPTADLILIGGPCVNTLVAQLLNMSTASGDCYNEFVAAYPTKGVVKVVEDAFVTGKKALIVAGKTASDTRDLADNYVIKGDLDEAA